MLGTGVDDNGVGRIVNNGGRDDGIANVPGGRRLAPYGEDVAEDPAATIAVIANDRALFCATIAVIPDLLGHGGGGGEAHITVTAAPIRTILLIDLFIFIIFDPPFGSRWPLGRPVRRMMRQRGP